MSGHRSGGALAAAQRAWFATRDAETAREQSKRTHPAGKALLPPTGAKDTGLMTPAQYERTAQEFRSLADVCRRHAENLTAGADLTAYSFQADRARQLAASFRSTADVAEGLCRESMDMAEHVRAADMGGAS